MDKSEAIELLEKLDRIIDKSPSMFESDFGNALDMAIESLKKEDGNQ